MSAARSVRLALAAALLAAPAAAQEGRLHGTVAEAGTAAPVAGARVTVAGPASAAAIADAQGRWSAGPIPAGEYRVRAAHPGFAPREAVVRVAADGDRAVVLALTPSPLALDGVVATASRRLQTLAEAPVATEVLTRADIERSGATDLAAALGARAGFAVQGGHTNGTGVYLQGLGSERVLVLVDGQPLVGRIAGQVDLSRIPTSAVERVEVVKGPQSTLYGSEAMGGVINVVTRAPVDRGWGGEARLAAGGQSRRDAGASWHGALGAVRLLGDVGVRSIDVTPGVSAATGTGADRTDVLAKALWSPSSALSTEASVVVLDERQRWRTGQIGHFADNRQWSARAGAEWRVGAHRLAPTLYASTYEHNLRRATGTAGPTEAGDVESQRLAEAELVYGFTSGAHAIDAGIELRREGITSDRVTDERRTLDAADAYLQDTWKIGRLSVVPGARVSHTSQWGTHAAPRLALLFRPVDRLALRASAAGGYRAPSFKELYMDFLNAAPGFSYVVRGNPGLEPETSTNFSLGAEWAGSRFYARAQGFANEYRGFIETAEDGDSSGVSVFRYQNVDDGWTRGVELQAGAAAGGLRLDAAWSRLWTRDEATGAPLLGRPEHTASASASYAWAWGLRASLAGAYTGRTPLRREDAGETSRIVFRDAYLRVDARLAQALPRGVEIALGAENLFDTRPAEWPGYTGRHVYAQLSWRVGER